MTDALGIAWTTLPSRAEADRLAADAVATGFAACAQVEGPIRSHYTWEGRTESEDEFRVTFKFAWAKAADLQAWIHTHHPYDLPQWIGVQADLSSPAYRAWILGIR